MSGMITQTYARRERERVKDEIIEVFSFFSYRYFVDKSIPLRLDQSASVFCLSE